MVRAWAESNPEDAAKAGFAANTQVSPSPSGSRYVVLSSEVNMPAMGDEMLGDGLYGLNTRAPDITSLYSVDTDESVDEDDGASTCSDDSFVTALEEPSTEARWEANTVLNSSYVPMEIDPVDDSDVIMADTPESKPKRTRRRKAKQATLDVYLDHPATIPPVRKTGGAAGYDLYSAEKVIIPSGTRTTIDTGIIIRVPDGVYCRIASRSGMALKGMDVEAGVVNADYTG